MFSKPGRTLMDYARILFGSLLILVVGIGVFVCMAGDTVNGILIILLGSIGAFLTCLLLAAIGQAVESLRIIAISTHSMAGQPCLDDEVVE